MTWTLLLLLLAPEPLTVRAPSTMSVDGWSVACEQTDYVTWSTSGPPELVSYGSWCEAVEGDVPTIEQPTLTLHEPAFFDLSGWVTWPDCMTGPGFPISECRQSDYIAWSTRSPPENERYPPWCYASDVVHPTCLTLGYDQDNDNDIDLRDWAIWTRLLPVDMRYEIAWNARTWRVKWDPDNATPYLIELP